MLDLIAAAADADPYDFRAWTCPDDPLAAEWDGWLPYYAAKHALAAVLRPDVIVEIGVRYGYGAGAFLAGSDRAVYVGYDNDSASYGGNPGSLGWAASMLAGRFPGRTRIVGADVLVDGFDVPASGRTLIHLDGPQGIDCWGPLLDRAVRRRDAFVLVDGYYWTADNRAAVDAWLIEHRARVAWWGVLPTEYGDLLIGPRSPR